MAMKTRKAPSTGHMLHFLLRFIGLNGLVAVAVGASLWQALDYQMIGSIVALAGLGAIGLALLGEMRGLADATFSHRGAAGINVVAQITLATALVVGGNYFSFHHSKRHDCTAKRTFTLDKNIREKLTQMRGDTDIIIYVPHVSFGQRVELRQDEYDQAAEKKIVEKVKDLAEQFQEVGPNFRVHILDTQEKTYKDRVEQLAESTKDNDLLDTIKKAPENSIFFYARDSKQLQRLSFNDIYQLDKKASEEANDKKGNLVLNYQGVNNFAEKVFKIEEKKPRIGFAVIHGFLGQDGTEEIGMPGLKDALAKRGYDGRDIVLKNWAKREAAALEHDESRFEILETKKSHLERDIKEWADEMIDDKKERDYWINTKIEEIGKDHLLVLTQIGMRVVPRREVEAFRKTTGRVPTSREINEEFRAKFAKELSEQYESYEQELESKRKKLAKAIDEQSKLRVDNLAEQRRITNVRDKMKRLLADVDLLVVPRATYFNLLRGNPARGGDRIQPEVHELEATQIEGIKDFIRAGKPVMFCLGPISEPGQTSPERAPQDALEKMLAEFNVELPNQMILYNTEAEALAELDEREMQAGRVDVPPVEFDWKLPPGARLFTNIDVKATSPIRGSMRMTSHSLGNKNRDELKIHHLRPVYVVQTTWEPKVIGTALGSLSSSWPEGSSLALAAFHAKSDRKIDEKAVLLMTNAEAWNEEKPFPANNYMPRFKRSKSDDPTKDTFLEKRRGPFPIGVALEADVPTEWFEKNTPKKPVKVRLAVIGHGGLFIGDKLPPMREKLFLDVSNWLLGRDNLLAKDNETWKYPRVEVTPVERILWVWGVCRALPFVFLYLGTIVWLVRRMR